MLRGPSIAKERQRRLFDGVAKFLAATPRTWIYAIGVAGALVAAATLVRLGLEAVAGKRLVFACYYPVITLAAVLGGYRAGAFSLVASAVTGWFFFAAPQGSLAPLTAIDSAVLMIFLVAGILEILIGGSLRHAVLQLRDRDAELRLIAQEHRHRVKNVLALVQSVSRQISRSASDVGGYQIAFEARLRALAGAHDILARSGWTGADLRELVGAHLNPFVSADGPRLRLQGEDVTLRPDAAVSLSLVLHELATNAVKYGALSTPNGELQLSWRCDAAADSLVLDWLERGGPRVEPPARKGFGATLIARALAPESRVDFEPEGLHVVAVYPLGGRAAPSAAAADDPAALEPAPARSAKARTAPM